MMPTLRQHPEQHGYRRGPGHVPGLFLAAGKICPKGVLGIWHERSRWWSLSAMF
jgi:hypothetical protein